MKGQEQCLLGIVVDIKIDGLTTFAQVRGTTPDEEREMGAEPATQHEGSNSVGYGIARCRKDDHYEAGIGVDLATSRALLDYATAVEKNAKARVQSEKEFQVAKAVTSISDVGQALVDAIEELAILAKRN